MQRILPLRFGQATDAPPFACFLCSTVQSGLFLETELRRKQTEQYHPHLLRKSRHPLAGYL